MVSPLLILAGCAARTLVAAVAPPPLRAELVGGFGPLFVDEIGMVLQAVEVAPAVVDRAGPGTGWVAQVQLSDGHLVVTLVRPWALAGQAPPVQLLVADVVDPQVDGWRAAAFALRREPLGRGDGGVFGGVVPEAVPGLTLETMEVWRAGDPLRRRLTPGLAPEALIACARPSEVDRWTVLLELDRGQVIRCEVREPDTAALLRRCLCDGSGSIAWDHTVWRAQVRLKHVPGSGQP